MAKYMLLIYGDETQFENPTPEQWDSMMKAHGEFAKSVVEQGGQIVAGEALQFTSTATSVRDDGGGGHVVTDGPFVETKEVLGGFYIVDATDLDQAIAFAKLCPAPNGGIEVRPIQDTSGGAPGA